MTPTASVTTLLPRSAIAALARRPDLWVTGLSAARSMARHRWWAQSPYLPVPDPGWLSFRLETAYGRSDRTSIEANDLITWLEWKRDFPTT